MERTTKIEGAYSRGCSRDGCQEGEAETDIETETDRGVWVDEYAYHRRMRRRVKPVSDLSQALQN